MDGRADPAAVRAARGKARFAGAHSDDTGALVDWTLDDGEDPAYVRKWRGAGGRPRP